MTAKRFLIENNEEFEGIVKLLTTATIEYLLMQIKSGADVIKIFDSWAGALNADMVLRYSLNPIKKIVSEIKQKYPNIPFIVFTRSVNSTYSYFSDEECFDVLAVDQFLDRKWIAEKIQPKKGRCFIMDGSVWHSSSHPRKTPYRIVVNINFK